MALMICLTWSAVLKTPDKSKCINRSFSLINCLSFLMFIPSFTDVIARFKSSIFLFKARARNRSLTYAEVIPFQLMSNVRK